MAGYSPVIGNRLQLDLYANVRPVKLFPGVQHRISGSHKQVWRPGDVDMVFIRENTEGLYSGIGGRLAPGGRGVVATDTRLITRAASERVIKLAFELARFAPRVRAVRVLLCDENGPRGGTDKRCVIRVSVPGAPPLLTEQYESDLYVAIDRASDRAGRTLARWLGRTATARKAAGLRRPLPALEA